MRFRFATLATVVALGGCAPRAKPLEGTPAPAMRVPGGQLPSGRTQTTFRWEYEEPDLSARGEGVARVSPPDSARLDLFLGGGFGGGAAVLVADELRLPGGSDGIRRFIPPPPLLWAALGRLAVPPSADTTVRVDGDILRADIGRDPVWRATFAGEQLVRLERIEDGRIAAWVARETEQRVRYRDERSGRTLTLTVERRENALEFDARIWRP
jgi:hypothetical protein